MHYSPKKLLLGLFIFPCSTVFAGDMGSSCSTTAVTSPCPEHAWLIGGQALYIQPTSNIYGIAYQLSANNQSLNFGISPSWSWGFEVQATHLFDSGRDFNVNWYHYRHSNSYENNGPQSLAYTYPNATSVDITLDSLITSINPQWDQVNFEFGQKTIYDDKHSIRFHGGAQYSRVANNFDLNLIASYFSTSTVSMNDQEQANAAFNGFGPRVGLDLFYSMPNDISLYAKAAIALLAGNSKAHYLGAQTVSMNFNQNRVIPALDGKIGFDYRYAFKHGDLALNMGWLWVDYINVLAYKDDYKTNSASSAGFEVQGLYFGLSWLGQLA